MNEFVHHRVSKIRSLLVPLTHMAVLPEELVGVRRLVYDGHDQLVEVCLHAAPQVHEHLGHARHGGAGDLRGKKGGDMDGGQGRQALLPFPSHMSLQAIAMNAPLHCRCSRPYGNTCIGSC